MSALNEDFLVQQTTADYLRDALGWNSILAYNDETFGPGGTLGRNSDPRDRPHALSAGGIGKTESKAAGGRV